MRVFAVAMLLLAVSASARAGELLAGFQKALAADPVYQAARAEYELNKFAAVRAGRAYWPEFGVNASERTELKGFQTTIQIAQPVVDADRYATWRGAGALETRAAATMRQREAELIQRYYSAVSTLVRAKEQLELNQAKTKALEEQAKAARRALELGTGTKTDVYDTEVKLSLARAEALTLRANFDAAGRQYRAQTGEPSPPNAFALPRERRLLPLPPLGSMLEAADAANPQVVGAIQNEHLVELDVTRKYGAFLPRVNAIAKRTIVQEGQAADYIGLAFQFPLQSGSLLDLSAAKAALLKASAELDAARQTTRLQVQRLYELVATGRQEQIIRLEAIQAAKLGLEATEKSFKGGVRSQIDVLNSIQTLFQTNDDYVASVLGLGVSFIALHAMVDTPAADVLDRLERFLF